VLMGNFRYTVHAAGRVPAAFS